MPYDRVDLCVRVLGRQVQDDLSGGLAGSDDGDAAQWAVVEGGQSRQQFRGVEDPLAQVRAQQLRYVRLVAGGERDVAALHGVQGAVAGVPGEHAGGADAAVGARDGLDAQHLAVVFDGASTWPAAHCT